MVLKKLSNKITNNVARVYNKTHWFSDKDGWMLYRLFAFTEAIGWTLLICAIIYRKLDMPGYEIAVSIAGTTHGLFFSLYFIFVIATARSMEWGFWRLSGALLAGMPPYTAIVFEKYMAHHRKKYPVYVAPPADYDS